MDLQWIQRVSCTDWLRCLSTF